MGDPAGIGPEICVRALADKRVLQSCTPVIIGDKAAMESALRTTGSDWSLKCLENPKQAKGQSGVVEYIDMNLLPPAGFAYGKVSADCGRAAFGYVKKVIDLAMAQEVQGTVTGPINKEAMNLAGIHYSGHTEIFADLTSTKSYAMMLLSDQLRVIHATTHVSMRRACDLITKDRIYDVIMLSWQALRDLGIENPRIAVAGLNPHCSENGLFGSEEALEIIPAIEEASLKGILVTGPVPPDTVFVRALAGEFDVVVAMYHDQGHIPLKLCGFKVENGHYTSVSGVNFTVGLPIIRTSVDHGTAFDKAGKGTANAESMVDAILMAAKMAQSKATHKDETVQ
ncbi:MAG: 4-hydroxythreonine-4-phosphate dehydrogenase PdxA [Acetanaerobacterium sp.]